MKLFAFDVETHLIQPGLAAPPIVCGSIASENGAHLLDKQQTLRFLRAAFLTPGVHIVGCAISFDLACCAAADPTLLPLIFAALDAGRIHDIAIREALIDIGKGELVETADDTTGVRYGLELLVERHLGLDISSEKEGGYRKRYHELDGKPLNQWPLPARIYPLRDAVFPLEIVQLQETIGLNLHAEADEVRADFALRLMSVRGLRANRAAVAALRERVEAVDRENTARFVADGLMRDDGTTDMAALRARVSAAYEGLPPRTPHSKRHPTGQVATDRDTLLESGDPLLETFAIAGKNDKYLTTYLPILERAVDHPWNPKFNVLVATTRVSSDAQQFPQVGGVRDCFEARPGFMFNSVDFGGLELRTMAQDAKWSVGFSKMGEALTTGKDCHLIAAASFAGVPLETAKNAYKAGDKTIKIFRDVGKIFNFGKGGGMGPGAMVYNSRSGKGGAVTKAGDLTYIGTRFCVLLEGATTCGSRKAVIKVKGVARRVCAQCLEVVKRLDARWLAAYPEQKARFDAASRATRKSLVSVEIPVTKVRRGKCGYSQLLNTPFQGLGAAATKRAMYLISREMYSDPTSPMWGSYLVLNVHDELVAEHPEAKAPEAADRMAFIMRETLKLYVPDMASAVEAEPTLSRVLSKDAKTLRDGSGRLLVWEAKST